MAKTAPKKSRKLLFEGTEQTIQVVAATTNGGVVSCQTCPVYVDLVIELQESTKPQSIEVDCTLRVDSEGKARTLVIRPKE